MAQRFATLSDDGTLLDITDSPQAAVEVAGQAGYENVEFDHPPDDAGNVESLGANPSSMPRASLQATGLVEIQQHRVDQMTIEEAHAILLPYFQASRERQGKLVAIESYNKPAQMARRLLAQNYKTAKETPELPSDVQGLSLTPHSILRDYLGGNTTMKTLCVGSSPACRASCLVFSGQNAADPYNLVVKIARTRALLEQPVAFVRMLAASIASHIRAAPSKPWTRKVGDRVESGEGVEQFFRLNVFQDVPWELITPWLFSYQYRHRHGIVDFSRARFYDYTKVPGRRTPSNYDLTFSFSGVNHEFVDHELHRGRRIAAVFLLPGSYRQRRVATLPATFMGYPVVDGDVSDVRPRDPAPGVVGLRWKLPKGTETGRDQVTSAFVIPCTEVDGQVVAGVSARMEPIKDADSHSDAEVARWQKVWED